jgi:hypothetical protein
MESQTELKQAAEALKMGDKSGANRILGELVRLNPDNAEAWLMLFSTTENPIEKCDCLKQTVRIRPNDERVRQKLHKYQAGAEYREAKASVNAVVEQVNKEKTKKRKQKEGLNKFLSILADLVNQRR